MTTIQTLNGQRYEGQPCDGLVEVELPPPPADYEEGKYATHWSNSPPFVEYVPIPPEELAEMMMFREGK